MKGEKLNGKYNRGKLKGNDDDNKRMKAGTKNRCKNIMEESLTKKWKDAYWRE